MKRYKNDILLIATLLLLAVSVWGMLWLHRKQGGKAVLSVDGQMVQTLPLDTDTSVTVKTEHGHFDTVVVEAGRVCVLEADCPDQVCVRQGWVQYAGESIVCLPNKLVITIYGGKASLDATAQ